MKTIFLVVVVDLIGFGIVIPLLPFYSETLGANTQQVASQMAVFSFMQFLTAPFWGALSDKWGRKKIILITLFGSCVSYIFLSITTSFMLFLLARAFAGAMAGNIGVAQAYIADITDEKNRAKGMGLFGAAFGIGFILGPAIGGMLAGKDPVTAEYSNPMIFAAFLSALAFVIAFIFLKEPNKLKKNKNHFKNIDMSFFKISRIKTMVFLLFIMTFVFAGMESTFAMWSERNLNWGPQQNGWLFTMAGLLAALVQGLAIGPLTKIFKEEFLIIIGFISMFLGCAGIAIYSEFIVTCVSMSLIALGLALISPSLSAVISKSSPYNSQGIALGISQSVGSLARITSPLTAGALFFHFGYSFPYYLGSFLSLFSACFLILSILFFWKKNESNG